MNPLNRRTSSKLEYFNLRKNFLIPKYIIVIFLGIFFVSIILNFKLLFFPQTLSYRNVPFDARITEVSSNDIIVKGFGENIKYFRDSYRIVRTDTIQIVNEEGQSISFDDLKAGMYVSVRVVNYDFNFVDMDTINIVTKIKCSESKDGLHKL